MNSHQWKMRKTTAQNQAQKVKWVLSNCLHLSVDLLTKGFSVIHRGEEEKEEKV